MEMMYNGKNRLLPFVIRAPRFVLSEFDSGPETFIRSDFSI